MKGRAAARPPCGRVWVAVRALAVGGHARTMQPMPLYVHEPSLYVALVRKLVASVSLQPAYSHMEGTLVAYDAYA